MDTELQIGVLEQKHAMKILLHLNNGPMVKGELASKITIGTVSVQARIDDLIAYGLVTEKTEPMKPFKKIITLTEKGKKISMLVTEIEKELKK